MSFAAPLWLLALVVVPLALGAQWLWRRRARRYALRYTAAASLAAAAGGVEGAGAGAARRGRWVRALPLACLLAALAALVLALARPQVTHRVPIGDASVMLVLDHSGSMAADDVAPSRIQAAISAGNRFIGELPADVRVGFVGFGTTPDAVQAPVADHTAAKALLDAQQANGGTDTGPALALALQLLGAGHKHHPPSAIVLLSDGAANLGTNPVTVAAQAKADHVAIDTVALGTPNGVLDVSPFEPPEPVPPDPQLMAQIAQTSGGRAFDAKTAGELSSIYATLGSKLGRVKRERDITTWVVLAAALLLVAAVGLSVRTTARVA